VSEIKKGDRVRLLPGEFEVSYVVGNYVALFSAGKYKMSAPFFQIEKIEPPVVKFKPGDVIRWKKLPRVQDYLVLRGGDLAGMTDGRIHKDSQINSEYYELVEGQK